MHVSYFEDDYRSRVDIGKGEFEIEAHRHEEHVTLRVTKHCKGILVEIEECFTCDEWDELLCQLSRVNCGPRECEECDDERVVVVFNQDDCDERPKPKTRTTQPKSTK